MVLPDRLNFHGETDHDFVLVLDQDTHFYQSYLCFVVVAFIMETFDLRHTPSVFQGLALSIFLLVVALLR